MIHSDKGWQYGQHHACSNSRRGDHGRTEGRGEEEEGGGREERRITGSMYYINMHFLEWWLHDVHLLNPCHVPSRLVLPLFCQLCCNSIQLYRLHALWSMQAACCRGDTLYMVVTFQRVNNSPCVHVGSSSSISQDNERPAITCMLTVVGARDASLAREEVKNVCIQKKKKKSLFKVFVPRMLRYHRYQCGFTWG